MAMTNMNIAPMTNTLVIDTIAITRQVMRRDSLVFFFISRQRYNKSPKAQNFRGRNIATYSEKQRCITARAITVLFFLVFFIANSLLFRIHIRD
jgi:hypothetical protein